MKHLISGCGFEHVEQPWFDARAQRMSTKCARSNGQTADERTK